MGGGAKMLRVELHETGTLDLYYQENTSVHEEDALAPILTSQWSLYHQKRSSGRVRAREMTCQTPPSYTMDKTTQKSTTTTQDSCCMVTQWSMYDEYHAQDQKEQESVEDGETNLVKNYYYGEYQEKNKEDNEEEEESDTEGSSEDEGGGGHGGVEVGGLLRGLGWVERQLSSTDNIHLLHAYTGYTTTTTRDRHGEAVEGVEERRITSQGEGCRAEELWNFACSDTHQRRVNHVTYCNSQWLVVAAYGEPCFTGDGGGLLCGWSAKRIGHPEVRVNLSAAATVVSCCPSAPQLCCVALLDGTLHVYQLDSPTPLLLLDTSGSVYKHCGPVWSVEWRITQSANPQTSSQAQEGRRQALVSASEDGTVKEWLLGRHGTFRCTTLMKVCLPPWVSLDIVGGLKEILPEEELEGVVEGKGGGGGGGGDGSGGGGGGSGPVGEGGGGQLLPDAVPATSLKFRPGDSTSYLVGTVAGHLLVCRTFERRDSVAVFGGHRGLVTALDWRPNQQGDPATVFLSAALDDTIRVWHLDKPQPHCILKNPQASSGPGGYVDACWCPWYGNLVAGVHGGGLHLWDISVSTHTPALTHPVPAATCVAFSPHTRNVVVGDRSGAVRVVHLEGLTVTTSTAFHRFSTVLKRISVLGMKSDQDHE